MIETEEALADAVIEAIRTIVDPLIARIKALEARPAEQVGVTYEGTYAPDKAYKCGSLVTRNGGLWLALEDTLASTPGASTAWRLIVKSGGA